MRRIGLLLLPACALLFGCNGTPKFPSRQEKVAASSGIQFEDVTRLAGIAFRHHNGADGRFQMPESVGAGGAFLDYDGDGRLDIFLVNGANWPDRKPSTKTLALYRNVGDGKFRDATKAAGLAVTLQGMGCTVGDYDNDGRDDLFITCVGPNRLFRNLGGRFRDETKQAGLDRSSPWAWHTGAAWVDFNRDGLLDLFVCRYVKWSPETDIDCFSAGKPTYCGPAQYPSDTSELYRNLGGGRFQDVSKSMGIGSAPGRGFSVLPVDVNRDSWPDLLVTNDGVPNHLFLNRQGKAFENTAERMGFAVGPTGEARAGMGIDFADVRNDGGVQIAVGNFSGEGLALFDASPLLDARIFSDVARETGLLALSFQRLTFGLCFLDADSDGWQDLFAYNGHVDPLVAESGVATTWKQPPLMLKNKTGSFVDVTATVPDLQEPQTGRGCAVGDFDDDGRPDLLLCENDGPTRLLRNTTANSNAWLGVRLRGTKSNRNAYGAEVRLTSNGITQRRWIRSGGSYLTHSDSRALFGLGESGSVEKLEITWPDGKRSEVPNPTINRYLDVLEP